MRNLGAQELDRGLVCFPSTTADPRRWLQTPAPSVAKDVTPHELIDSRRLIVIENRLTAIVAPLVIAAALGTPVAAQTELTALSSKATNAENASARSLVIRRPGSYFLRHDLLTSDEIGIDIRSSDVTVDLRGHTLVGLGDRIGIGIKVAGVSNVEVFNGKIQDFGIGVQVGDSTNVSVTGLQIDGQDLGGAPPDIEIGVLIVDSRGVRVENNSVSDTFLGVFVRGEGSGANLIAGNVLAGGENGELAICYNPAPGAEAGGPSGDLITDNLASRFRRGFSFSEDSTGNVLRENSFAYFDLGIVEATPGSNVIADNDEVQIAR